jgi:hypothetical protein
MSAETSKEYPSFVERDSAANRRGARQGKRYRGRNWWIVTPTGEWGLDNKIGADLAEELIAYERANGGGGGSLQLVVLSMIDHATEKDHGIIVGFMSYIADVLARGSPAAQETRRYWRQCELAAIGKADAA